MESLTGLHGIELSGNPWSCDCRLRPLKEWLVASNVPQAFEPTCASPPRLENKKFIELTVDEFACPPDLLSAPRFVEANAGESFRLKLLFFKPGQSRPLLLYFRLF